MSVADCDGMLQLNKAVPGLGGTSSVFSFVLNHCK